MSFSDIIGVIDDWAWSYPLLILLVGTGLFLSIRLAFVQFRKFGYSMKNTAGKMFEKKKAGKGEVTPFQALTTALAATVGTGNIVGVATAIVSGGPGAIFWMWVAAILGLMTNFSENVLGIYYRRRNEQGEWSGGAMYYLKDGLGGIKGFKQIGSFLATIFAIHSNIYYCAEFEPVVNEVLKEQIAERHARTLLNITDPTEQQEMLKKIIDTKMSVRMLEEEIKKKYPKDNSNVETPTGTVATASAFVNNNPLMPTAELPEDTSNYGKVTIAPPKGEDMPMGKFINYGEIDDEDNGENGGNLLDITPTASSIDVNEIQNKAEDININKNDGADLDSLLNLGNPTSAIPSNHFITPAEKIVKTDPGEQIVDKTSDYFKIPEFSSISTSNNQTPIMNSMDNRMFLSNNKSIESNLSPINQQPYETPTPPKKYTIEELSENIKNTVNEYKENGLNVSQDEMNFEKSFQIIIKVDKTKNKE